MNITPEMYRELQSYCEEIMRARASAILRNMHAKLATDIVVYLRDNGYIDPRFLKTSGRRKRWMPQAPSDLQRLMMKKYGSLGSEGPEQSLRDAGYRLRRNWFWGPKDGVKSTVDMTIEEYQNMLFLQLEWDYGGLMVRRTKK